MLRFDHATTSTQHNSAAIIQADHMERVLTNINADHGNCAVRFWDMACSFISLEPLPDLLLAGQGARPTIPLADITKSHKQPERTEL